MATPPTRSRTPIEAAKALYEAFGRGDIAAVLAIYEIDVEWNFYGPPEIPYAGPRRGRAAMAEFFERLVSTVSVEAFSIGEMIPAGDHVFVTGHEESRVKATGKLGKVDWIHLIRVKNGQITRMCQWYDTATMAKAYFS